MSRRSLYSLRIGLSFVNVELRAELLKRMERDQEVRRGMRPGLEEREEAKLIERLRKVDGDNTSWLRDVISTHGWPGITLVGEDGAHAAWLLVQHAPQNLQEQCLPLLERAVEQGEARKRDWAYLLDRVLMHRGELRCLARSSLFAVGHRRRIPSGTRRRLTSGGRNWVWGR